MALQTAPRGAPQSSEGSEGSHLSELLSAPKPRRTPRFDAAAQCSAVAPHLSCRQVQLHWWSLLARRSMGVKALELTCVNSGCSRTALHTLTIPFEAARDRIV